ncbi:MAG: class I SAM-dependent methyltransferase [Pseudomonadota bacterium]
MTNRTFTLPDTLYDYLCSISLHEPDLLRRLREETARDSMANMQISPEQGQFMSLLVRLMGARRSLEIGVYTGYSALSVAMALPNDGNLIACDISKDWTGTAMRYWREAGVEDKIDLRLGPALDTLDHLLEEGREGTFDFAFIDADKVNYWFCFNKVIKLLRSGGLIAVDNTLWGGNVINPNDESEETQAIRSFNRKLHNDERVNISLVPIGDGLTLALKRSE